MTLNSKNKKSLGDKLREYGTSSSPMKRAIASATTKVVDLSGAKKRQAKKIKKQRIEEEKNLNDLLNTPFFKLFKTEFLFDNQKFKQQLISNYKFNVNNFLNFVYGLDKLRSELRLLKKQYSESEYKNFLDKLNYQTIGINVNNYQKNVGKVIIPNFNKLINNIIKENHTTLNLNNLTESCI